MYYYHIVMQNISWEKMEAVLTELNKRTAALEIAEDARQYRESLLYPQFKSLCNRQGAEDVFNKTLVGPHNRPIVLPSLLDEDETSGVYKTALQMLTEEEKTEMAFIKARHLQILQLVAARRATRMGKAAPTQPTLWEGGPK